MMATFSSQFAVFSLLYLSILAISWMAILADHTAGTPKLSVPEDVKSDDTNGNFRTFKSVRKLLSSDMLGFDANNTMNNQLSSNYQGVTFTMRQYNAGDTDPPSINPFTAELLLLLEGTLEVGFIDTKNKLYKNSLQAGDMFVFPSGLVHFKYNPSKVSVARTASVFGGLTGTAYLPPILLSSGVDDRILAQAFKTDQATIKKLKAGVGSHTNLAAESCTS